MGLTVRRICLYLLLVLVFGMPWQEAASIPGGRSITILLGFLLTGVTAAVVISEGKIRKPTPFFAALLLLTIWELLTVFWTIDTYLTLRHVMSLAQILVLVWLVTELARSEKQRIEVMQAYVLGCLVLCAAIIQSFAFGKPTEDNRYAPENFSLNPAADMLAVGIVLALMIYVRFGGKRLSWLNLVFIPVAVFSVVLTASRSGFIATSLALLGFILLLKTKRPIYRLFWGLGIVAAFAGLFFGLSSSSELKQNLQRVTFSADTQSIGTLTGRTDIWSAGVTVFKEHPIRGTGAGTFRVGVRELLDRPRAPHNLFLSTAVESGLVGLILLGVTLLSAVLPAVLTRSPARFFYLILFAVLMLLASVANVDRNQVVWLGLSLLALGPAVCRQEFGLASEGDYGHESTAVSLTTA